MLIFKADVALTPHPAGARLLGSLERVARTWPFDIEITSGSEQFALHGPENPHTRGYAFDLRSHGFTAEQKAAFVGAVLMDLREDDEEDAPQDVDSGDPHAQGSATRYWYMQVENIGTPSEHFHCQLRKGVTWPERLDV